MAIFGPGDQLWGYTRSFEAWAGHKVPLGISPEPFLRALGFSPQGEDAGRWEKEGLGVRVQLERLSTGLSVLTVQPIAAEGDARERWHRFLQIASHDVRGAIANARSYAALLADRYALEERVQRSLRAVVRNSDRAISHLRDFFDTAQLEFGKLERCLERQPVAPLLRAAAERCSALASEHGVRLELQIPEELPELELDADLFLTAVAALWEHAIASASQGSAVTCRVDASEPELKIELSQSSPAPLWLELGDAPELEGEAAQEGKLGPHFRLALACVRLKHLGATVGTSVSPEGNKLFFSFPI